MQDFPLRSSARYHYSLDTEKLVQGVTSFLAPELPRTKFILTGRIESTIASAENLPTSSSTSASYGPWKVLLFTYIFPELQGKMSLQARGWAILGAAFPQVTPSPHSSLVITAITEGAKDVDYLPSAPQVRRYLRYSLEERNATKARVICSKP